MKPAMKRMFSITLCILLLLAQLPATALAAFGSVADQFVYCQAPQDWDQCFVYWWGSESGNPVWPGHDMWMDENGVWCYAVPVDVAGIIFNDGIGGVQNTLSRAVILLKTYSTGIAILMLKI